MKVRLLGTGAIPDITSGRSAKRIVDTQTLLLRKSMTIIGNCLILDLIKGMLLNTMF